MPEPGDGRNRRHHRDGNAIVDGQCGASPIAGDQSKLKPIGRSRQYDSRNRRSIYGSGAACVHLFRRHESSDHRPERERQYHRGVPAGGQSDRRHRVPAWSVCFLQRTAFTSGRITGTNVLLYVAAGTFDVDAAAIVDLSANVTPDGNMLVWVASANQTLTIAGGQRQQLTGPIYAPRSKLQLSSVMAYNIGGINVKSLKVTGAGAARLGLPIPSLTITPASLPSGKIGIPYGPSPTASGGTAPYILEGVQSATGSGLGVHRSAVR